MLLLLLLSLPADDDADDIGYGNLITAGCAASAAYVADVADAADCFCCLCGVHLCKQACCYLAVFILMFIYFILILFFYFYIFMFSYFFFNFMVPVSGWT